MAGAAPLPAERSSARFVLAIATTSASQVAIVALSLGTTIVQARLLEAEGRGELARFANAAALAVLYLGLGIGSAVTYFVASGATTAGALRVPLQRTLAWATLAVVVGTLFVAASPLGRFLPGSGSAIAAALGLGTYFLFAQAGNWITALLAADRNFKAINVISVVVACAALPGLCGPPWRAPAVGNGLGRHRPDGPARTHESVLARPCVLALASAGCRHAALHQHSPKRATPTTLALLGPNLLTYAADGLQFMTYRFDMWVVDAYYGGAELAATRSPSHWLNSCG